ncbi:MAG: ribosome small subunit-dependent GTPase A [Verrucomicrobiota bacterium]
MSLASLGWSDALAASFHSHAAAGLTPARVALQHKHAYEVLLDSAAGALTATCTGKLLHTAGPRSALPAVGDWVALRVRPQEAHADIHAVLPRRTTFSRRAPGESGDEQIVATNIDTVFLVTALDQNYNLRRIERYLAVAWESGAQPVVLLNKADLHPDAAAARAEVEAIAATAPVVAVSALHDASSTLTALAPWLIPGHTLALLGSSGVGKSTLINALLGTERQLTGGISDAVGKGRHTTTHRELIVAPAGWIVVDTPGMRELQLWDTPDTALDATFSDVAALAAHCRFSDCAHRGEPGCAIQAALDAGTLDFDRWQSFQKLQREQAYAARKSDPRLARARQAEWKKIHRQHRADNRSLREFPNL